MTRHDLLTYLRGRSGPVRLGVICAALNTTPFQAGEMLKYLLIAGAVAKPARGFYEITEEGRAGEFPEFVQQWKNCPVERRTAKKRKRVEWVNPYAGLPLMDRINAIVERDRLSRLAPGA